MSSGTRATTPDESKRLEKLLKKAKQFLDDKQKIKSRLASLYVFLDATNELDQASFFQQHDAQVFNVVMEGFRQQAEKIRQRADRISLSSKEFTSLRRILGVLRKIFLFLPDRLREGWQGKNIASILRTLLDHGNHHKLRMEGLRLLLLWIYDMGVFSATIPSAPTPTPESPLPEEVLFLYSNAIRLDLFLPVASAGPLLVTPQALSKDQERKKSESMEKGKGKEKEPESILSSKLNQEVIRSDSGSLLYPNPTAPNVNDSIDLLEILLANLTRLAYVAAGSTPPSKMFPLIFREARKSASDRKTGGKTESANFPEDGMEEDEEEGMSRGVPLGTGIDAATAAVRFMFGLLKRYYLVKLFPEACKNLKILPRADNAKAEPYGFQSCPPSLLETLIVFLIRYCIDARGSTYFARYENPNALSTNTATSPFVSGTIFENDVPDSTGQSHQSSLSPAIPILMSILLGTEENRELVHEMVRQSLLLPLQWSDVCRGGIHVLAVWLLAPDDERPAYLRRSHTMTRSASSQSLPATVGVDFHARPGSLSDPCLQGVPNVTSSHFSPPLPLNAAFHKSNLYVQRYIKLLKLVFEKRPEAAEYIQAQVLLYKDVLFLYRAIAVDQHVHFDRATWETLLTCLLDIQERLMNCTPGSSLINAVSFAEEVSGLSVEILLSTWLRSETMNSQLWLRLQEQMKKSTEWKPAVVEWEKHLLQLTRTLAKIIYGVDMDTPSPANARGSRFNQNDPKCRSPIHTKRIPVAGAPMSATSTHGKTHDRKRSGSHQTAQADELTTESATFLATQENCVIVSSYNSDARVMPDLVNVDPFIKEQKESAKGMFNRPGRLSITRSISVPTKRLSDFCGNDFDAVATSTEHTPISILATASHDGNRSKKQPLGKLNVSSSFLCTTEFADSFGSQDKEKTLGVWKGLLCILGNPNDITQPEIHALAIQCLVDVWDTLAMVRERQPFDGVPIPPLFDFAPWMFQAGDLPSKFNEGRTSAYGCLCRIMCREQEQPCLDDFVILFYEVLLKGLVSNDISIIAAILANTTNLFHRALPGSSMLIPAYISTITSVLNDPIKFPRKDVSDATRQNAVTILASLVSVSNNLGNIKAPSNAFAALGQPLRKPDGSAAVRWTTSETEFLEIKTRLKDVLIPALLDESQNSNLDISNTHSMLLCCVSLLAFEELLMSERPDKDIIIGCLGSILDQLYSNVPKVVYTAADCLTIFAQGFETIGSTDENFVKDIFETLIGAINEQLNNAQPLTERAQIIARLLYCALDWLMIIPPKMLMNSEVSLLLFDAIENALHMAKEEMERSGVDANLQGKLHKVNPKSGPEQAQFTGKSGKAASIMNEEVMQSAETTVGFEIVKEVATCVLHHALHHYNNYESPYGPALLHSAALGPSLQEDRPNAKEKELYFTYNDTTIITFVEIPSEGGGDPEAHVIVRDATGKYAWDCQLFYRTQLEEPEEPDDDFNPRLQERNLSATQLVLAFTSGMESSTTSPVQHSDSESPGQGTASNCRAGELPLWNADEEQQNVDKLDELLQYIGKAQPDCLRDGQVPLNLPVPIPDDRVEQVKETSTAVGLHIDDEMASMDRDAFEIHPWYDGVLGAIEQLSSSQSCNPSISPPLAAPISLTPLIHAKPRFASANQLAADLSNSKSYIPVLESKPSRSHPPFQRCRLLLSHLGLLNYDALKENCFYMLAKSPALYRDIKGLDKKVGRETMKVAVIYVGTGQEDEASILRNSKGSAMYDEFVSSLGWEVDLATHPGYLGGLERNQTNGASATYFCTSTLEIIFHDATKLPTDPTDPKQIKKKRHIGNDHVHIIWNEHARSYRRSTFSGDFGNVLIVVTPIPESGLFAVDIHKDAKIPPFGPIIDKTVLSGATLGPLVRMTAVHAFRATFHTRQTLFKHSFSHRAADIQTINTRHKGSKWSYSKFMSHLYMLEEGEQK